MIDFLILFFIAFGISTVSMVVGSMTPIYLSLMQFFFPVLSMGTIIGCSKVSNTARGIGGFLSFWSEIDWKFIFKTAPIFVLGGIAGANLVSEFSSTLILPILILAFFIAEFAPYFSRFFTGKNFLIFEFFMGFYTAVIAASAKIILLAVYRMKEPDDAKIMWIKIQIQVIMFFVVVVAAITHYFHGNLIWDIVLPLVIGDFIGGFMGGKILKKTGKFSGDFQKNIMRLSFLVGIAASAWMMWR